MAVLIKKNIREILEDKDPNWAGFESTPSEFLKDAAEYWMKKTAAKFIDAGLNYAADIATNFVVETVFGGASTSQAGYIGIPGRKGGAVYEYGRERASIDNDAVFGWNYNDFIYKNDSGSWDGDIREVTTRINSVLEQRSYLDFYFPNELAGTRKVSPKKGKSIIKLKLPQIKKLSLTGGSPGNVETAGGSFGFDLSDDTLDVSPGSRRRVAFFENPSIREDRTARYATQAIVARNEPARLYVGSEARKLKLDFTFTIPHIEYFFNMTYMGALVGFDAVSYPEPNQSSYKAYFEYTKAHLDKFFGTAFKTFPVGDPVAEAVGAANLAAAQNALQIGLGGLFGPSAPPVNKAKFDTGFFNNQLLFENKATSLRGPHSYDPHTGEKKDGYRLEPSISKLPNEERHLGAISRNAHHLSKESLGMMATYYTQFVIDTIRASVVGDTTQQGPQGPPIVRFRHGTNFREESYIVKNYSITYPTDKGYEYRTLIPRQVKFSLSLEEFNQTHGSHHGDIDGQVPDGLDILSLTDFG